MSSRKVDVDVKKVDAVTYVKTVKRMPQIQCFHAHTTGVWKTSHLPTHTLQLLLES